MLKKRLVACLIVKDGIVVQSIGFRQYLPVGSVAVAVEFLNKWGIDEIIILDIDATPKKRTPSFHLITEASKKSFVPLTVGGGIQNLDDMKKLIHFGADKIAINTISITNPHIISEAAGVFGNQCIVVSIDVKVNEHGGYEVFTQSGRVAAGKDPVTWAEEVEKLGAGEILLTSVDRDGSKRGYDLNIVKAVSNAISIPLIACGGVGHLRHFVEGIEEGGASAVSAGNFFHFTEHSPIIAKEYMRQAGIDVRLDTYANYKDINFDEITARVMKRPDQYLEMLRFEYHPEEVI